MAKFLNTSLKRKERHAPNALSLSTDEFCHPVLRTNTEVKKILCKTQLSTTQSEPGRTVEEQL